MPRHRAALHKMMMQHFRSVYPTVLIGFPVHEYSCAARNTNCIIDALAFARHMSTHVAAR
jgi:hypothetical protein